MKRTIQDIFDLETGECLKSDDLLNVAQKEIFKLRRNLEIGIQKKDSKLVCAICHQPIKLRAGLERIVHFAHLKDSENCPIKTDTNYSKAEWLRMIYHGTKESKKHIDMKNRMNDILNIDERFSDIKIKKTIKDLKEKSKWKKPDVQCKYNNKTIVFEMQISHTFLSEIVARDIFYDINEIPLYWICDNFYPYFDYVKVFHCDILYHHNCNLIVLDNDAYKYSIKNRALNFKVYWLKPHIKDKQILYDHWCQKIIDFSEIKYDMENNKLFYYDYEKNENEIKENIIKQKKIEQYKQKKERVFNTIRKLDGEHSIDNEIKCIKAFKNEINSMNEFKLEIWHDEGDVYNLFFLFRHFLSLKENKFYGYDFKNVSQLLNNFFAATSKRDLYWLLILFLENGNYEEKNNQTFLKQKEKYINSIYNKNDRYTEYLHWFFPEIKSWTSGI
jgi:competence CoiA-like predicted nuclease